MKLLGMLIGLVLISGLIIWYFQSSSVLAPSSIKQAIKLAPLVTSDISVAAPLQSQLVASPLVVSGQARGSWFFEASFPVILSDANGNELASAPAQAQGDWMTQNFVPFQTTLNFSLPNTATGTLVFKKDNPSGLPQYDGQVQMEVRFH